MKFLGNYNPAYLYFNCISTLSILFSAFTSVGLFGKNRLIINFHFKTDALGYGWHSNIPSINTCWNFCGHFLFLNVKYDW